MQGINVVVTGGSGGIGTGVIEMFLSEGARVANIDVKASDHVRNFIADVSDPDEVSSAFAEIDTYFDGPPHVLVNVAGVAPEVNFLRMTPEVFDRTIAINLRGPFLCAQQAARRMVAAKHAGRIVNITSTEAEQAHALQSAYSASKGGLRQLTRGMAIDLAPHGILVNAIGPGTTQTANLQIAMATGIMASHDRDRTPLGRMGTPADIAAAVRFLARDATWMTGETIYVDGGFLSAGLPMFPELTDIERRLPTPR